MKEEEELHFPTSLSNGVGQEHARLKLLGGSSRKGISSTEIHTLLTLSFFFFLLPEIWGWGEAKVILKTYLKLLNE